jgi:ABC-type nitrate/sulfonate/bicarbonate transport system substrate-binding protein
MGSEAAVRRRVGKILVDVRRGDDPAEVRRFTFAALATTDRFIERDPERAAAAVRAIVKTQRSLRVEPALAAQVARRRFPFEVAELVEAIVERDLPFYDPVISAEAITGLNRFAQSVGLLPAPVPYEKVVAMSLREFWRV